MNHFPNFSEFYQRRLILIGEKDRSTVKQRATATNAYDRSTHWLIAVEGSEVEQGMPNYHWKVSVYPAQATGTFNYKFPYFTSPFFPSMDDAIEFTKKLEEMAKEDQLLAVTSS